MRLEKILQRIVLILTLLSCLFFLVATRLDPRYVLLGTFLGFLSAYFLLRRFGMKREGGKKLYQEKQKAHEQYEQIKCLVKRYRYRISEEERQRAKDILSEAKPILESKNLSNIEKLQKKLHAFLQKHLSFAKRVAFRSYITSTAGFVFVALLFRAFVASAFEIPSGSMIPTLHVGDYLVVSKSEYGIQIPFTFSKLIEFRRPAPGDIVVFAHPNPQDPSDVGKDLIKRVVAVEGDQIAIKDGVLFVNGEAISREYTGTYQYLDLNLFDPTPAMMRETNSYLESFAQNQHTVLYEKDWYGCDLSLDTSCWPRYLAPTDHRGYTCRWKKEFCVSLEERSTPFFIPKGYVFVMGDSRDNSADSRFWGPLPISHIKGKALFIGYSGGPFGKVPFNWDRLFHRIE